MAYIGAGVTRFNTADELTVTGDAQIDTTTLVVDSTNNRVGIGTASPSAGLEVEDANGIILSRSGYSQYLQLQPANNSVPTILGEGGNGVHLGPTSTTGIRVNSSGNVGVGETAPANLLHVKASDTGIAPHASAQIVLEREGTNYLQFLTAETGTSGILFGDGSDVDVAQIKYDHSTTSMQFVTEASEAFRIDSSRNLLVGKTTTVSNTAGHSIYSSGAVEHTRDSNSVLYVNRTSTDGAIAEFRKDGTTVGSIGAKGGDLIIGTGDVGIRFNDASDALRPTDQSTGSGRDNAIDIGDSGNRFKDLYLSGGAYLGGTGAANKLDDYEEGTFTATLNASSTTPTPRLTTTGQYTKIGNKVTVSFEFNNVTTTSYSGSISIFGMPFASSNPTGTVRQVTGSVGIYSMGTWDTASSGLFGRIGEGGTEWYLYANRSNDSWYAVQHSAGSQRYLIFNATYIVA